MNELDKATEKNNVATPATEKAVAATLETTAADAAKCDNRNACEETESPAEAISEMTDQVAETKCCAETESPAEAISEMTDRVAEEKCCAETESPAEAISEMTDRVADAKCCIETESPAEAISEMTDRVADAKCCVETKSPAEAISEATDAIEGESYAEGETGRRFSEMNKEELVNALEEIVKSGNVQAYKEANAIKQAFYILHNKEMETALMAFIDEGNAPENFASPADPFEARLKELHSEFKTRRAQYLEAEEARKMANLERRNDVLAQMTAIIEDIDNINLNYSKFRELQQQFREIKDIPQSAETDNWKKFQNTVEQFYDRLKMNKELRDLDFKKNLEAKEEILKEAEALQSINDPIEAFRRLQTLHDNWRELGPVAKEKREEIWNKFKELSSIINKRHQDFFLARKEAEQAAEAKKTSLCEKMDELNAQTVNSYAKWEEETEKVKALQAEWKETGFASRKMNTALFNRFREACDIFFGRKAEFYKSAKQAQADNLEKKLALCEKAEALKASVDVENMDIKAVGDQIAALQAEWKKIGAVSRKYSDSVWKRFCDACNFFYETRKQRSANLRKTESANLAAKRDVIEQLQKIDVDGDHQEGIKQLRALQAEWQKIGHVPFRSKDAVYNDYRKIVDTLYETFNVREQRNRMSNYEGHVDKLSGDGRAMSRERDRLYRALEGKKNELKTVENNLGFFNVKSSAGNSLLKDVERRIARIKKDIEEIKQKISMLDSKSE